MHFTLLTITALSTLIAASPAPSNIQAVPAPHQTHATQIKHLNYKCPRNANSQTCARAKATLYQKELRGCDVIRKSTWIRVASWMCWLMSTV